MIPAHDGRRRVLAVTTDLAMTGAKRVLVDGALGIDRARFEPRVLLLSPTDLDDPLRLELEAGGVTVHHLPVRSRFDVRGLRALARWLESEARPDIIHTHSARSAAVARLALWRRRHRKRPRVIVHFHGTVSSRALRPTHRLLDRLLLPCTDLVLAPSAHAAERGGRLYAFGSVPTRVVANGVDLERLASPRRSILEVRRGWGVPARGTGRAAHREVGTPRRDRTCSSTPCRSSSSMPNRSASCSSRRTAASPYQSRLEARIATTDLRDSVVLAGRTTDTASCYAAADVVVMPSRDEPFGLVAVEAMAAGRPLVAARTGGLPEVCGEIGVRWVEPGDVDGTARAVLALLSEAPDARQVRSEALRARSRLFALPRYIERLERAYDDVLGAPPPNVRPARTDRHAGSDAASVASVVGLP